MMVIVLIRRCVKKGNVDAFLEGYQRDKPDHPDFIDEHLTRVSDDPNLGEAMKNLTGLDCGGDAVTFINVALWKSTQSFEENFQPQIGKYDRNTETCDRARVVLEEV